MASLKDELANLKSDFVFLQTYLKEKITYMETKLKEFEEKVPTAFMHRTRVNNTKTPVIPDESDSTTRRIVEGLMWEGTLSEASLQVSEIFGGDYSREKFLRSSLEMVLDKDEQYRKMIGNLYCHLIDENVITQSNLLNCLSSVLLVIENSNNHDTRMWQNLCQILLPVVTGSHVKLLQVQRKAKSILKPDYFREFNSNLTNAVEVSKAQQSKHSTTPVIACRPAPNLVLEENNPLPKEPQTGAGDKPNFHPSVMPSFYEMNAAPQFTPEDNFENENCRPEVQSLIDQLNGDGNFEDCIRKLKKLLTMNESKVVIEEIIYIGIHESAECRIAIGELLTRVMDDEMVDAKIVLTSVCKNVLVVEKLIMNQNTRKKICEAFANILSHPLMKGKIKLKDLITVASLTLPEETKIVFIWLLEKILNEKWSVTLHNSVRKKIQQQQPIKALERYRKYTEKGERLQKPEASVVAENTSFISKTERNVNDKLERSIVPEAASHEAYLLLKREKLLKERIENHGDRNETKAGDVLNDHAQEVRDAQPKPEKSKDEAGDQVKPRQPENLPSNAIKEKIEEIVERLMQTNDLAGGIRTIKETFNECQTDLVFKAAFEYTKDKSSEYRIMSGTLIAEAFKHHSKRIGAQIINIISLELGEFDDSPDLWKSMAEIICPSIISGLIQLRDLKLLPKCFLRTEYCASLLLTIFAQVVQHTSPEWLEENWKNSEIDLSTFLPSNTIYKFITENNLGFILSKDELNQYKEAEMS